MPTFSYKAKNQEGKTVEGKVEAANSVLAAGILKERALFVISVKDAGYGSLVGELNAMLDKVSTKDVVNFTRQLSTMITSGLTLTESFRILLGQSHPAMAKVVANLNREIEGGSSFADALSKHPTVFPKVYVALVRSGEAAGVLDRILTRLADNLEKAQEFRAKTKGALIYPAIIVIAMTIVTSLMMIVVMPKLADMYKDMNAELPGITKTLMSVSTFMSQYWYILLAVVAGAIYGLLAWKKTPSGQEVIDRLTLRMPVFGPIQVQVMMTEFTRTLSLMLGAGVSLLSTLQIVGESLENGVFRKAIRSVSGDVEKGLSFSEALVRQAVFPSLVGQMTAVGEETGKLDEVLIKVSNYFESESEHALKNLSTALEPVIMILLGIGVGFLIIAIVMPIYNLSGQIQ